MADHVSESQYKVVAQAQKGSKRTMYPFTFGAGQDNSIRSLLQIDTVELQVLFVGSCFLSPIGLCIDESSDDGRPSTTKNKKTRYAPIPDSLRGELNAWNQTVEGELIFPSTSGAMYSRAGRAIRAFLKAGRAAAGVPHMTFRHCRTTFATLYEGDPRDRQAILGHHSEEFTRRIYQKPILARQKASVEELEGRLASKIISMPRKETA